jgi:hypothetical protein
MPVILATKEAEIRRVKAQSQPVKIVHQTLSRKNPTQKRTVGAAQGVGPKFNHQYWEKKKAKEARHSGS